LIVLDPITAFLAPSVAFHSDPSIRRALAPLAALAENCHCAVVLVRHLAKAAGRRPLYRGLGFIGLIASCRLAWLAGRDPRIPSQAILANTKTNLGACPQSLSYIISPSSNSQTAEPAFESPPSAPPAADAGAPPNTLTWLGSWPHTAADLSPAGRATNTSRARAQDFLRELLKDAPLSFAKIRLAARRHKHSLRTLRRAARDFDIHSCTLGNPTTGQTTFWSFPVQPIPQELDPYGVHALFDRREIANRARPRVEAPDAEPNRECDPTNPSP
jgi:hypothetical protein